MRTLDDVPLAPAEREAIEAAAVALRARFPVSLLARKVRQLMEHADLECLAEQRLLAMLGGRPPDGIDVPDWP